jgi:hypothetical protein
MSLAILPLTFRIMDEMEKRVAKMLNKQTLRRMQGSQKLEDVVMLMNLVIICVIC